MVLVPAVAACNHTLRSLGPISSEIIQVPWHNVVGTIGELWRCLLLPHRNAIVRLEIGVVEAANACHCAKIVVEGSVLFK